ncbi:MAG: alpha/beta hydrolase [Cyanothece sp. SIO2G6]|nr:alpha/beta hydrolase [Cyanothece sp. SIO2G6]
MNIMGDRTRLKIMVVLLTLLGLAALAYTMVCLGLRRWQTRLIFVPDSHLQALPTSLGLEYEEVDLAVGEGNAAGTVQGWWIPADTNMPAPADPVVLYLHGNGSNLGDLPAMAQRFHQLGWTSFLIDYRGYGRSQGPFPNEERVYEDAEAAWIYLMQQRQIAPQQVMVYGHSLGGAIGIELATRHPTMAGLIVEGSFTSMYDVVTGVGQYRFLPIDWILTQRFESLEKVRSLPVPLLFLHGTEDDIIPPVMSQSLYDAATGAKSLVWITGAGHNNLPDVGGNLYVQALQSFATQHVSPATTHANKP